MLLLQQLMHLSIFGDKKSQFRLTFLSIFLHINQATWVNLNMPPYTETLAFSDDITKRLQC